MANTRAKLKGLALSDTGFLFDPATGHMYTVNRCGCEILKWLREGVEEKDLSSRVAEVFDVTADAAEHDCALFLKQIRDYRLLDA